MGTTIEKEPYVEPVLEKREHLAEVVEGVAVKTSSSSSGPGDGPV